MKNGGMFLFVIVPFFMAGTVVFALCTAIPMLRRFALSASLWCLALIPGALLWIVGAAALMSAEEALGAKMRFPSWQYSVWHALNSAPAKVILIATGCLLMAAVATAVATLHQLVIHRVTLALFRFYAAGVAIGVAFLSSLWVGLALISVGIHPFNMVAFSILLAVILCSGAGWAGYRWAGQLRGTAPERFACVTREEFEGTV